MWVMVSLEGFFLSGNVLETQALGGGPIVEEDMLLLLLTEEVE